MSASDVIEEIKRLPRVEREKVIKFAREAVTGQLSPEEIGELTRRMVEAKDPAEAARLEEEIVRGFYGDEPHA